MILVRGKLGTEFFWDLFVKTVLILEQMKGETSQYKKIMSFLLLLYSFLYVL